MIAVDDVVKALDDEDVELAEDMSYEAAEDAVNRLARRLNLGFWISAETDTEGDVHTDLWTRVKGYMVCAGMDVAAHLDTGTPELMAETLETLQGYVEECRLTLG